MSREGRAQHPGANGHQQAVVTYDPHMENFRMISPNGTPEQHHAAMVRINSGAELAAAVLTAASDSALGERARAAAAAKRGAASRAADAIVKLYESRYPHDRFQGPRRRCWAAVAAPAKGH